MRSLREIAAGAALAAALLTSAGVARPTGDPPNDPLPTATDSTVVAHFLIVDGDTLWLAAPLEILGSRVPVALPGLQRYVSVLDAEDLARLPGRSVPGQLQIHPSVSAGQRQSFGIQSDLSIRGSTFEQVQILLDSYDVSDPQTGHHLLDLPVGPYDIAWLEVLPGHGSAQYGSGAFGGTVNAVTRRPGSRTGGEAALTGGGDGVWGVRGSFDLAGRPDEDGPRARLSFERMHTDGHTVATGNGDASTEADAWTAFHHLVSTGEAGEFDLLAGAARREFGAPGFYAPYPSWERTQTFFVAARARRRVGDRVTLEPRVFGRRHEDHFELIRAIPSLYTNNHATRRLGAELRGLIDLGAGQVLAVGLEGAYEDIVSTGLRGGVLTPALGEHQRRRASFSAEYDQGTGPWRWQLGGRLDGRSDWRPRLSGTAAASCELTNGLVVRTSAGTMYRVPTFTDLYYDSPTSRGDPDLQPEIGWAWDLGAEMQGAVWHGRITVFERHEEDLIDWARPVDGGVWQVMNIATGRVRGAEVGAGWRHARGHRLDVGAAHTAKDLGLAPGFAGRYALIIPEWVLTGAVTAVLPGALDATLAGRYVERSSGPEGFGAVAVVDARLDWRPKAALFASLVVTNVLDRIHAEVPGVPLNGALATVTLGMTY